MLDSRDPVSQEIVDSISTDQDNIGTIMIGSGRTGLAALAAQIEERGIEATSTKERGVYDSYDSVFHIMPFTAHKSSKRSEENAALKAARKVARQSQQSLNKQQGYGKRTKSK